MRNLKLKCYRQYSVLSEPKFLLLNPYYLDITGRCYVVTDSEVYLYEPGVDRQLLARVQNVIAAEYIFLRDLICLATSEGEVSFVDPDTKDTSNGISCDVGIESMAWSPDQEVVVFVTKQRKFVVMTSDFETLAEYSLGVESTPPGTNYVNLGWGKKETQFHGSEGKGAAMQKLDDETEVNMEELPKTTSVDWRADSKYFVVSYVSVASGRTCKVFSKEGTLHYVAEQQKSLSHIVSWRPCGTWIAIPQKLRNKSVIGLFEKNCRKHRELELPFDLQEEPIKCIKWSSDSEILCIKTQQKFYLYTICNYHWYLKQVLEFSSEDPVNYFHWDNRVGEEKTLHILLNSGNYLIYKWYWVIDRYNRTGLVYVVDGKRLLITDFSKAVVPPPMSSAQLNLDGEAYINSICLHGPRENMDIYIYDSKHNIHVYKSTSELSKQGVLKPLNNEADNLKPLLFGNLQYFVGLKDNYLTANYTVDNITHLVFITTDLQQSSYTPVSTFRIPGIIYALFPSGTEQPGVLFYQLTKCKRLQRLVYDVENHLETSRSTHAKYESLIENLEVFVRPLDANTFTIALHSNNDLFVNSERIDQAVTSYCIAGNYITYTKLNSLHFLRLSDLTVVNERRLERGSKLVTTVAGSARTVLQMPRGNLEAICPRVLSLELVGALLDQQKYYLAFDMMRKDRINLNLLCDHNMCDFVDRLYVFLQEITLPNWLNIFLSDLSNEDYTKTMYSSNYDANSQKYPEGFEIEKKVSYLCKALCLRMKKSSDERFRLPILTAYVKMGDLERALEIIWEKKKCGDAASSKIAEDTLKYLLYLVDVNELYNVALGTYDFGLVLFVAQKSQKDPKEYLAFLNELKSYELNYRKFKIDDHLKRYEKALQHISNCGREKFEEALTFIERHECYAKALKAFKNDEESYREVCLAFADYLRAKGKFENASILYERGLNLQQALLSARHVLDWQRVLVLAQKLDPTTVNAVAISMISPLKERGEYLEAYELAKNYDSNFKAALDILFEGKLFLAALYEIQLQKNNTSEDLIQSLLLPRILTYHSALSISLTDEESQFIKYKERLLQVRTLRSGFLMDHVDQVNIDECDLLSDTTSLASSRRTASSKGTGKTFRSSKNRRKHERKVLSIKPGNPFEDIAYVDALYNMITKCHTHQQHIHDICKALILCDFEDLATDLQQKLKHLLKLMKDSLDEIWIPELLTISAANQGPNIDNIQLANEQRYAMLDPRKRIKPHLTIIDWEHDMLLRTI